MQVETMEKTLRIQGEVIKLLQTENEKLRSQLMRTVRELQDAEALLVANRLVPRDPERTEIRAASKLRSNQH